ncbi:MAG: tape measure protein, partial [Bacteroidota bacterium]
MASQLLIRVGIRLDNFEKGIKTIERKMSRLSSRLSRLGSDLSTNISLPVAGVATAAVSAFAKLERLENGLKAIADEGEDTAKTLERLQRIAQLPGISLEQAIQGSNQLRNVGFEARQAEIILRELSKAVTLSGAGPEQLQSVVRQLVQMSSKGRILQEDLGVILENVPSVGIAIQDAFGTQSVEAIRATGVSAQEFTAKIIQAISANEKFQNVQGGLANDFDNFRQSVIRSLAALGRSIAESINLSGILEKLSSFLERVTKRFESLSITTQRFIVIGAGIAVVIGPVITVLGVLAKAFVFILPAIKAVGIALAVLATPVGAAVAAIGFFTAAISVAYKGSKEFRATIAGVIEVIKKFAADAVRALTLPVRALTDLLRGDLQSAQQKVKQVLGIESGENAGEAFARAYNSSIAKSIAEETSRRVSRQTGRRGRLGGTTQAEIEQLRIGGQSSESQADLSKIFANLPTSTTSDQNPIRKSNEEFEKQSRLLGDIIAHELNLQRIREGIPANFQVTNQAIESLSATTQGLTAELTKPIEELGIRFQELPNQLSPAQESLVEYGNALAAINDRSVAFG